MSDAEDYDYPLPQARIAQHPLAQRIDARLMVVDRADQSLDHRHVRDLPQLLRPGDCLVLNNTRVIPARLVGHRTATEGRWQGLFLEVDAQGTWRVLSRTRGRLEEGETVTLHDPEGRPHTRLQMLCRLEEGQWAAKPVSSLSAWDLLEQVGRVPLPPYIRGGEMQDEDREQYQTVYAQHAGSVAAPTAGLHFTKDLLQKLAEAGVSHEFVTLHVGIGTFRPMAVERVEDHVMHKEYGEITSAVVDRLREIREAGGRIVAVGTTSVRVLETAAAAGKLQPWSGETDLYIRPPYTFRAVDALLTNFHLPRSSLLVLVSAFAGLGLIRRAYRTAVEEEYRFYSYGDAMLIR